MRSDEKLIELLVIQAKALQQIELPTDKLDCLSQMIGTCAKLSRRTISRMSINPEPT